MSDLLEYAETAGMDNMRERIEVAGLIQRESNTALTLLLSGAGAALGFAALRNADLAITAAALSVSVYLFFLAALLNWKCLGLIEYPACSNVPANLNKPEYEIDQIREWELENLQLRIEQAITINEFRGKWLNRCRLAATLTPILAVVVWVVAGSGDHAAVEAVAVLGFLFQS